jgi:hypothetical protein
VKRNLKTLIVTLSVALLAGCSTTSSSPSPKELTQRSPGIKQVAHRSASGSACGIELFDFLPIGTWTRTERAYHSALTSAGARALLKPTVSDMRFDLMVATVKCSSVEGTAIY